MQLDLFAPKAKSIEHPLSKGQKVRVMKGAKMNIYPYWRCPIEGVVTGFGQNPRDRERGSWTYWVRCLGRRGYTQSTVSSMNVEILDR